jgi:hypothetical protein
MGAGGLHVVDAGRDLLVLCKKAEDEKVPKWRMSCVEEEDC